MILTLRNALFRFRDDYATVKCIGIAFTIRILFCVESTQGKKYIYPLNNVLLLRIFGDKNELVLGVFKGEQHASINSLLHHIRN